MHKLCNKKQVSIELHKVARCLMNKLCIYWVRDLPSSRITINSKHKSKQNQNVNRTKSKDDKVKNKIKKFSLLEIAFRSLNEQICTS